MATVTYNDIHISWSYPSNINPEEYSLRFRNSGGWGNYRLQVYDAGAWTTITDPGKGDTTSTKPRMLVRNNNLWTAVTVDVLDISVCGGGLTPSTSGYTTEWIIPSSMFGLTVSKFVVSYYFFYTKQYGGGTGFRHRFRRGTTTLVSYDGQLDNGSTCNDADPWAYRGDTNSAFTFVPGDSLNVYVYVPNTVGYDYGGTRVLIRGVWYFT